MPAGDHRIPAAALGVAILVQDEARVGLVAHCAQAAHEVRTPARTDVAEEPAAGNVELHAFPLVAVARRAALEIGIVDGVFEINREVRVDPDADTDTAEQDSLVSRLLSGST